MTDAWKGEHLISAKPTPEQCVSISQQQAQAMVHRKRAANVSVYPNQHGKISNQGRDEMTDTWSHGSTMRWHSNPWPALRNSGDTVDAHQNRMLRLRRMLWPGAYPELDDAILSHDLAEVFTRDWSRPDKDAVPGLQAALDLADECYLAWIGANKLNMHDLFRLKFLDQLDAYRWAVLHEPRCAPEWERARRGLWRDMESLGMAGMEGVVFG